MRTWTRCSITVEKKTQELLISDLKCTNRGLDWISSVPELAKGWHAKRVATFCLKVGQKVNSVFVLRASGVIGWWVILLQIISLGVESRIEAHTRAVQEHDDATAVFGTV